MREKDGTVTDLTPSEGHKAFFYDWAADDRSFFIGSNERDQRFFDVYEYDVESYSREMIHKNEKGRNFQDISRDRRYLVLSKTNSNADSDLFLHNRDTGETTLLTDFGGDVQNHAQAFGPNDAYFYYTTDKDSEFSYLVRQHLDTSAVETVVQPGWDVWYAYFSKNGKYLIVGINRDARTDLQLYEADTMTSVDLPRILDADITSVTVSNDEKRIAFYASSSRIPRDLFVADLDGGSPRQLTSSLNEEIDPEDLVGGTTVRFSSYDGLEIPGILYKPLNANSTNRVPVLVWVHGGPGGQSRFRYSALFQYLLNHGFAIYAINNRGSDGYGKTFYHLDDHKHGNADLNDVVESRKMLAGLEFVDPERIGIIGGSYGGYITLAALAFRPDAFDVGVDLFGISNWHRTVQNIPSWWESYRAYFEKELGPFDDEEFFRAKSPLFHAEQIRKPLIVLQGANDPRVLRVESDEIVAAVRANGVPVEYLVFDDEGHGFYKKDNQIRGYRAIRDFLDKYLAGQ